MTTRTIITRLLCAVLAFSFSACGKNKNKNGGTGDPYGGGVYDPNGYDPSGGGTGPNANPNGNAYVEEIPLSERRDGVNFYGSSVNRSMFPPVYFAFDSYSISGAERGKIQQVASYLQSSGAGMSVIIAGHTDQAGTDEYNRNLGELRALAIRSALAQSGVDANRVQTVSYGEDMPAQPGNDSANRRGEFGIYR